MSDDFGKRISIEEVEEGNTFTPKFDENGLIPVITVEDSTSEILMHGYSNSEALLKSIESMEAHYWSRSREKLWKKGETSGLTQSIKKILIDDDQDCLIYRVDIGGLGASCHVGYKSCFYRALDGKDTLTFTETEKIFDPEVIYEGQENPTKL
tara:strand:- start:159 stop:617 length:459 start_codon:yes stop_codon:yes gene_type:complete